MFLPFPKQISIFQPLLICRLQINTFNLHQSRILSFWKELTLYVSVACPGTQVMHILQTEQVENLVIWWGGKSKVAELQIYGAPAPLTQNFKQEGHDGPVSLHWLIREIHSYQTLHYLGIGLKHKTPYKD